MKPILRSWTSDVKQRRESFHLPDGNSGRNRTRRTGSLRTRLRPDFKSDQGEALEITSRQFRDGTILEIVEDPADSTRTLLAVRSGDTTTILERFEHTECCFIPLPRDNQIIKAIALPDGIEKYGSPPQLARNVGDHLTRCVPISDGAKRILGAFVVCTWVPELLAHFPCLVVLGPNDLTIRLLRALRLLCRHALLVGEATSAGILQACSRWHATLLLFDYGLRSDVFRTLRAGVWNDMLTLQKVGLLSGFGPKLIAAPEMPAGMEDCDSLLAFSLALGGDKGRGVLDGREMDEQAKPLRRSLLGLRMDLLMAAASSSGVGHVNPVAHALPIRCLGVPFAADEGFCQELLDAARWDCAEKSTGLQVRHRAVSSTIFFLSHEQRAEIEVSELTDATNKILERDQEEIRVSPKKVGAILTALGFPRRDRGCSGYTLENSDYVKKLAHRLGQRYGVVPLDIYDTQGMGILCKHCREFGFVSKRELDHYERDIKPKLEEAEREVAEQQKKRLMEVEARMRPMMERLRRELGISAERDSDMRLEEEGCSPSE